MFSANFMQSTILILIGAAIAFLGGHEHLDKMLDFGFLVGGIGARHLS